MLESVVTPEELDSAMGSGAKLTEIAQRGENPYRDAVFRTSWDRMTPEPQEERGPEDTKALFAEIRADEHAARVRDYGEQAADPVPEKQDMPDTHEARVRASTVEKIAKHAKWLADEPGGERASWKGLYIDGDQLRGQDLRRADFRAVNIHNADLSFANLEGADFGQASFSHQRNPVPSQIRNSLFVGANLEGANLSGGMQALHVSFSEANLQRADFSNSGFSHADFENSDLRGAKLDNTGFVNADLNEARINEWQLAPARIKNTRLPDGEMHQGTLLEPFRGSAKIDHDRMPAEMARGGTADNEKTQFSAILNDKASPEVKQERGPKEKEIDHER